MISIVVSLIWICLCALSPAESGGGDGPARPAGFDRLYDQLDVIDSLLSHCRFDSALAAAHRTMTMVEGLLDVPPSVGSPPFRAC